MFFKKNYSFGQSVESFQLNDVPIFRISYQMIFHEKAKLQYKSYVYQISYSDKLLFAELR